MTPHLLLESALRASLLGAGVWVLLRVLRNRSSAREWMIWLAVLSAALLNSKPVEPLNRPAEVL